MKDKEFVVGIGETLWDMLPDGKKLGGAPANFAYHASQFGLASRVVSAVGRDELGDKALTHLDRKGLEHLLVRVDYPAPSIAGAPESRTPPTPRASPARGCGSVTR